MTKKWWKRLLDHQIEDLWAPPFSPLWILKKALGKDKNDHERQDP